jgi:pyrroline-5-carboxylate reductase
VAWREGSISLEALLDEAATPGGIAAATLKAADRTGYQRAVAAGLAAGMKQARKNAKLA